MAMPMKLKEVPATLLQCYVAKTNVWLWGRPGIGKTFTIEDFARKMRERVETFKLHYFYGPTMGPTDIQAAMFEAGATTMKIVNNGSLPNAYDDPDMEGAVFIGEAANTDPATFKLLQKYVNGEDMNGVLRKPDRLMVICDGNRLQDKAGVMQQGRAMMNRFAHLDVFTTGEDNIDYAERKSWHPFVQSFFKDNPDLIDNYARVFENDTVGKKRSKDEEALETEEGKRGIWACMRGWERISNLEYAAEQLKASVPLALIHGSVGTGVGQQYAAHREIFTRLLSVDQIVADPKNAKIPDSPSDLYGQCLVLAMRCKEEQLPKVHVYGKRLPGDMQSVLIRKMVMREGFKIIGTDTYIKWMSDPALRDLMLAK